MKERKQESFYPCFYPRSFPWRVLRADRGYNSPDRNFGYSLGADSKSSDRCSLNFDYSGKEKYSLSLSCSEVCSGNIRRGRYGLRRFFHPDNCSDFRNYCRLPHLYGFRYYFHSDYTKIFTLSPALSLADCIVSMMKLCHLIMTLM